MARAEATRTPNGVDSGSQISRGLTSEYRREWLIKHGVPHFTGAYSAGLRSSLLIVPLFAVLAYQLGAATWFERLTAEQLFLAPLVPVAMALVAARLFLGPFGLGPSKSSRWWLLPLTLLVPAFAALVVTSMTSYGRTGSSTWLSPHPWIDFSVIFTALVTAAVLAAPHEWEKAANGADKRWWLLAVVLVALLFFALEGAAFTPVSDMLSQRLWLMWPGLPPIPLALPALITMAFLLALSLRAARDKGNMGVMMPAHHDDGTHVAFRALPVIVLALGLDTALLRDYTSGWQSVVSPFVAILALAVLFALYQRLPARPRKLSFWLPLFVLAYPAWTLVMGPPEIMAAGRLRTGVAAFLAVMAINGIYVVIAFVVVEWGLDRITLSAFRGAAKNLRVWSAAAAQGLPLLLGITALSLLTAEFWEISAEMSLPSFMGFLALLVAPVVISIIGLSVYDLRTQKKAVSGIEARSRPMPDLSPFEWINGLLIVGAFNSLVFVGLTLFSFFFFSTLANLTVPSDVAAEWVYGDGQQSRASDLEQLSIAGSPWVRVPLILTAFSVLYVFVSVMASAQQRDDFFGWVRRETRKCFEVRLAYRTETQAAVGTSVRDDRTGSVPLPA